jgi:hypothetical protein
MTIRLPDRIVPMYDGAIRAAGSPWEVLTPEHIADVYGVEAPVQRQDDETPLVAPVRQLRNGAGAAYRRMHASPKEGKLSSVL